MKIKRFLMNEADASPGNGALVAPSTPPESQAQGTPPAIDVAAIEAAAAAKARDAVYAELRRTGVIGKGQKPKEEQAPVAAPAQPDLGRLRQLDRAIARTPQASRLSDAAYARLERAFVEEAPPDAGAWLKDYFEGMGVAPTAAPAATSTAATPRSATPVSDGGSPPANVPLEERQILTLSQEDKLHLIKQKGAVWYRNKVNEQTRNAIVKLEK